MEGTIMAARTNTKSADVVTPEVVVDIDTVNAYRVADKSEKATIRKSLTDAMNDAIDNLDLPGAASARATLAACTAEVKSAKSAVDPAQVIADRIATLKSAIADLEVGSHVPTGLDISEVNFSNLPTGTADRDAAIKLASAKVTRSGDRHSIGDVIDRAFADAKSGDVLTVAEIGRMGAIEGYAPSQGAIANRLKSGYEGLVTIDRDANGPLRARKA